MTRRNNARLPRRRFLVAAPLVLAGLALARPVRAQSLESAKAAGLVGERADGLLGVVKDGPGVRGLVESVNNRRMAEYRAIAQRNGTGVEAVQAIAGNKLIAQAPPGTYVMDSTGSWRLK